MDREGRRRADRRRLELRVCSEDLALPPTLEWSGCLTERERPRWIIIWGPRSARSSESSLRTSGRDWARFAFSCMLPSKKGEEKDILVFIAV